MPSKPSKARKRTEEIVRLYTEESIGHKAIATRLKISPRIARQILIEQGVYSPGLLLRGENHRRALGEKSKEVAARKASSFKGRAIAAFRQAAKEIGASHTSLVNAWMKHGKAMHMNGMMGIKVAMSRKETVRKRAFERYTTDPVYRLRALLRRRIRKVITHGVKAGSSLELLGCSEQEFKRHIENQFELGMTWENYGRWHLDHIKPCAAFDLTTERGQKECFNFSNYRPMWSLDNIRKGSYWRGKKHSHTK